MKKSLMKSTSGAGLAGLLICGAFLTQTVQADEIKPAVSEANEGVTANTAETNSASATPLAPVKPTETTETAEVSKLKAEVADLEKQVSETETAHKVAAETTATAQKELEDQKESNQQAQAEIDKRNKEVEELQKADQEKSAASYKDYLEYLGKKNENLSSTAKKAISAYEIASSNKDKRIALSNAEGNAGNIYKAIEAVDVAKGVNDLRKEAGLKELYVDPYLSTWMGARTMYSSATGRHSMSNGIFNQINPSALRRYAENLSFNKPAYEAASSWQKEKDNYLKLAAVHGLSTNVNDFTVKFIKKAQELAVPEEEIGHYLNQMSPEFNVIAVGRTDIANPVTNNASGASFFYYENLEKELASGRIMTVADYEKSLKEFAEQFQAQKPNQAKIAQLQAEIKDFQARIKDLADLNKKLSDAQIKENELAGQLQELRQKQEQAKAKLKTAETPKPRVIFTEEETKNFIYQGSYLFGGDKKYYSDEKVQEIYNRAVKDAESAKALVVKTPNLSQEEKENGFKEIDKDLALFKKMVENASSPLFTDRIYWQSAALDQYAKQQHQKVPSKEQTLKEIQANTSLSASNKLLITEEMMDYYNGPVEKEHRASENLSISKYQVDYDVASRLSNIQTIWNKYLAAQAKGQTATYIYQPVKDIQEVRVRYVGQRYEPSADGLGKYIKVSLASDEKLTLDLNDYFELLKGAKLIDGYRLSSINTYEKGEVTYNYSPLKGEIFDYTNTVPPKVEVKSVAIDENGKEIVTKMTPVQFTINDIGYTYLGKGGSLEVHLANPLLSGTLADSLSRLGGSIPDLGRFADNVPIKVVDVQFKNKQGQWEPRGFGNYGIANKLIAFPRQLVKDGKVYYQDTRHETQRDGDQNKVVYKYVLVGNEADLPKSDVAPEKPTQPVSPSKPVDEPTQPVSPTGPTEQPNRPSLRQRSLLDPVTGVSIFGSSDALAGVVRANIVVAATNVFGWQAYNAYDITLLNGNLEAVQPKGKVTVSLPTNGLEVDQVFHVTRDNQLEPLAFTVHQNIVTFETDHFSIYAVTYKTGQRVPERGTVSNLVSFTGGRSEVVQTATTAPAQTENKTTTVKTLPNTGETSNGFLALLGLVAGIFGIRVFTKKQD